MSDSHSRMAVRSSLAFAILFARSLGTEAAPRPYPGTPGPESAHSVLVEGVPGYAGCYWGGGEILLKGTLDEWTYRVYYPKPELGDLIPDLGRVYRVTAFPENLPRFRKGVMELEAISDNNLPPDIRPKCYTLAVSPGAVLNIGQDPAQWPPLDLRKSLTEHLRVEKVAAARDGQPATARVEVWSDVGDQARRSETLKVGDELLAGRWTLKVTNIVLPDAGRRIVGWVELELLSVAEETRADPKK